MVAGISIQIQGLEHREKLLPFRSSVKEKARLLLQRTIRQGQLRK